MAQGGCDKACEEGMRLKGFAFELWVVLHADEPGMVFQLNYLHQVLVGLGSSHDHSLLREKLAVLVIELIAVAVSLIDESRAVAAMGS